MAATTKRTLSMAGERRTSLRGRAADVVGPHLALHYSQPVFCCGRKPPSAPSLLAACLPSRATNLRRCGKRGLPLWRRYSLPHLNKHYCRALAYCCTERAMPVSAARCISRKTWREEGKLDKGDANGDAGIRICLMGRIPGQGRDSGCAGGDGGRRWQ